MCGRLADQSFNLRYRLLIAPRLRTWSSPLLRNKTTSSLEQVDTVLRRGDVQIEKGETKRPQTASQGRGMYRQNMNIQAVMDAEFGNTSGGALGAKFDAFVDDFLLKCSKFELSNFIRIAGKKSRNNTAPHMIRRLPDFARKLDSMVSSTWNYKDIAYIMYGLQSCKESDDGYLTIISTMSKIATRTALRDEAILGQSLSMILYGLKGNKFEQKESKEMLSCLHRIAIKCQEPLSAQAVGNALYGMQGMSSDDAEVRLLVRALSGQVERCREPVSAQ